jgi:hypothetical protein
MQGATVKVSQRNSPAAEPQCPCASTAGLDNLLQSRTAILGNASPKVTPISIFIRKVTQSKMMDLGLIEDGLNFGLVVPQKLESC